MSVHGAGTEGQGVVSRTGQTEQRSVTPTDRCLPGLRPIVDGQGEPAGLYPSKT